MSIASIRSAMLLPDREIIISKSFILQGKPALIASITEQCGVIKLWLFQQFPIIPVAVSDYEIPGSCDTNREDIHNRTLQARFDYASISEITIQGVKLPIAQSSSSVVGHDPMAYMKLQHFMEVGVDFSSVDEVGFEELILGEYQFADDAAFPALDMDTEITLSLCTRDESAEVLIEPSHLFHLSIEEQPKGIACSFLDPVNGREVIYYVDRLVRHDIWKQAEEQFHDEATLKLWREHGLNDEAIAQMRAQLPESIGRICPKGHELLLIQYETPDNIQLNFYTSEFLDSEPVRNSSSVGMIATSGDDESVHGFPVRTGILKTVPAGFDEPVDVELVSWYRTIPGERIEA